MRIFGLEISVTKQTPPAQNVTLVGDRGNWWWPIIREPFTGAWQRNQSVVIENVLSYHAVYACVTLIASDVAKCRITLVEQDRNGIWNEITSPSFSPVLRKPNKNQNRIKFYEQWVISKLLHGNTYVLKERDLRGVVVALYILDPTRTRVLVAPNGDVFYELHQDNLAGIDRDVSVPSTEIIHDVMVPLYHPLCGVSPLVASAVAAVQGLNIQNASDKFFRSGSRPGGVLTAPATISDTVAERLKNYWETNFSGENAGRVAVLGDGLTFEQMSVTASDSQLIEQLKWSAEVVCSAFHVPAYKIGVGPMPAHNNIEALERQYYAQCLQKFFECIELCLDEGLGLTAMEGRIMGVTFDENDLLRMDTKTMVETIRDAVSAGVMKPNEGRKKLGYPPVKGGDTPYLQQQNYSLAALDERDKGANPFGSPAPAAPAPQDDEEEVETPPPADEEEADSVDTERFISAWLIRHMGLSHGQT